jgi:hypothetical protein
MKLLRAIEKAWAFAKTDNVLMVLLSLALIMPLAFPPNDNGRWFGRPQVVGGDEPHYLVMINSLLRDGDFSLRNNYDAVHDGAGEAGRGFAHSAIDHHVTYYMPNGERLVWRELFEPNVFAYTRGPDGLRVPIPQPGTDPSFTTAPEYPAHPIGMAVLLAPVLFPFRSTELIEPLALFCSALAVVASVFLFRRLLRELTRDTFAINAVLIATFLGTSIWFYARALFTESFLLPCMVGAYAMAFAKRPLACGAFIAAAISMKPPMLILGAPMGLIFWMQHRAWRPLVPVAVRLAPLPAVSALVLLVSNAKMYGSPWRGAYPYYVGSLAEGAKGLLFDGTKGLLWLAPATLLAVVGWFFVAKKKPMHTAALLFGFVAFFILAALWKYWDGGWCFGPRLIVPVIPLLMAGAVGLWEREWMKRFFPRWLAVNLVLVSCLINLGAVRYYANSIGWQPRGLVMRLFSH